MNPQRTILCLLLALASFAVRPLVGAPAPGTILEVLASDRGDAFQNATAAAEAATDKLLAQFSQDCLLNGTNAVNTNLGVYRTISPTAADNPYWGNYTFTQPTNGLPGTWIGLLSPASTYAPLAGQFGDLAGFSSVYRIASNVRLASGPASANASVRQDVAVESVPIFEFGIYYKSLLELTWAATLTLRGRVHSDSDIYVGSSANLSFSNLVTTAGQILMPTWDGHPPGDYTGQIYYGGSPPPGYVIREPAFSLPIGMANTTSNLHAIIDPPPSGEDVNSVIGQQRFYNKAGMTVMVSNSSVIVTLKASPTDASMITTNWPAVSNFMSTNITFFDEREGKTVVGTQIDVGKFNLWINTNFLVASKFSPSLPLNIVYVADYRSQSSSKLRAVRLTNGAALPAAGLTVATPGPLYIEGNYNCPTNAYLGTTNTTASVPSSVISDALTILSPNWKDPNSRSSSTNLISRLAIDCTVNTAIITGVVYSTGPAANQYSGGLQNLTRLLEDWQSNPKTLTLNTSFVNLFNSTWATNQWKTPGVYYFAPIRYFNFDQNFLTPAKLPPGTPQLLMIERVGRGVIQP